jgi:hypothetical protein
MGEYLLSIYQPDGPPPPPEVLGPVMARVNTFNAELRSAGAWVFSVGLLPPSAATVLRAGEEEVFATDGPYTEGKEHVGGFWLIEAPDRAAALKWAGKAAKAVGLPIELRPLATR